MISCGGNGNNGTETELQQFSHVAPAIPGADSIASDSIIDIPPMTSQGLGPVRLGMERTTIPGRLPGVYDSIAAEIDIVDDEEIEMLSFMLNDSVMAIGTATGHPLKLRELTVIDHGPRLKIGGHAIGVGTTVKKLEHLDGLLSGSDDRGDFLEWRGVRLYTADDTVTALTITPR